MAKTEKPKVKKAGRAAEPLPEPLPDPAPPAAVPVPEDRAATLRRAIARTEEPSLPEDDA